MWFNNGKRPLKGGESEISSFLMLPRVLYKDPYYADMSDRAKVLFSFILERLTFSDQNGWRDENGYVFVQMSITSVMGIFNCSKPTATATMAELEKHELIYRQKQGVKRPNRIYVFAFTNSEIENGYLKNFDEPEMEEPVDYDDISDILPDSLIVRRDKKELKNFTGEVKEFYQNEKKFSSLGKKSYQNMGKKLDSNYTNNNYTNNKYNNMCAPSETHANLLPQKGVAKSGKQGYSDEFEELWKEYPRKKEKQKAYKAYKTRLKEKCKPEDMLDAVKAYADECKKLRTEESFIKHCATFLGPNRPFEDYVGRQVVKRMTLDDLRREYFEEPQENEEDNQRYIELFDAWIDE